MSAISQEIILPTTQRSSICWYVYIFCMFVMSTVFQVINSSYNTKIFNMLVCIHLLYVCNVYIFQEIILPTTQRSSICWYVYIFCMFVMSTVFQVINSSYNTKIFNMLVCIHLLYVCNVYSISGNQFFLQHKDLQYAGMYTSSVCL